MMTLDQFLEPRRSSAFAWGRQDCATFAADWVLARTGRDPMADLRGLTCAMSAMRRLRALGGFRAAGLARLGPLVAPLMAQAGDVCLMPSGRRLGRASGYAFGICNGRTVALPGLDGLVFGPLTMGIAAWRV